MRKATLPSDAVPILFPSTDFVNREGQILIVTLLRYGIGTPSDAKEVCTVTGAPHIVPAVTEEK